VERLQALQFLFRFAFVFHTGEVNCKMCAKSLLANTIRVN
jgi:hypothetical protein